MRITQAYISKSLRLFNVGFRSRWGLSAYSDPDKPALFFGMYSGIDLLQIKNHRGFKLVILAGADVPRLRWLMNQCPDANYVAAHISLKRIFENHNIKWKYIPVPLKDYTLFSPCEKGDKIYYYQNNNSNNCKKKYGHSIVEKLMKEFGEDMFITGIQGNTIEHIIENYYKRSFVNLQINPMAGWTSALEMAYMGRKSISGNEYDFTIQCPDVDKMIEAIEHELVNDNTAEVAEAVRAHHHNSDDWLHDKYWSK